MFNQISWITYFFSKRYTMDRIELMDGNLTEIFMIADSIMAPKLYPAHLAFQMYANGCTREAERIIAAAKRKHPELPYDKIPEFIEEDEKSFAAGEKPCDIIKRRIESMYLMFTGKPMDEDLKKYLTTPPDDDEPKRKPGEFNIGDFVITTDGGAVAGQLSGICTSWNNGTSRFQIVTESGKYGFGMSNEFRPMTADEISCFKRNRKFIEGIE